MQLLGEQALNGRPFRGPEMRNHPAQRTRHAHQVLPRCAMQAAAPAAEKLQPKNMLLVKAVQLLFSVKPIFAWASAAVGKLAYLLSSDGDAGCHSVRSFRIAPMPRCHAGEAKDCGPQQRNRAGF